MKLTRMRLLPRHCHSDACLCFLLLDRPSSNRAIAAKNRITVCFHAVLSKDFKVDPEEDRIFVQAGPPLGKWEDVLELSFTRY